MASAGSVLKRVLVGRPFRSDSLGETLLSKKLALPIFASDAMSSVGYATQEIMLVLAIGGVALYHLTGWAALGVIAVMVVVVASYRQNVRAYPSGGGDYEVATVNIGHNAGLTVASALAVDYVLTVAVSISSGVDQLTSAFNSLRPYKLEIVVGMILLIALVNLRGVRESGRAFAIPVYGFVVAILGMGVWGLVRTLSGDELRAPTADYEVHSATAAPSGVLLVFLVLRAFASGCTALTGTEAIANGVPAFKKPKSQNAATTLAIMGGLAVAMFATITTLAMHTQVRVVDPEEGFLTAPDGTIVTGQDTVVAQVAESVFGRSAPFYVVTFMTTIILVLAANTAFNGFPVLASILAKDRYLPRQMYARGDRLAFSNGILLLAGAALVLVIAFNASVSKLIQLYIIGVFVSFTISQFGMVRHWTRHLRTERDPAGRARMRRSRVINSIGLAMTGTVLIVVVLTKFVRGAYLAAIAMALIFLVMKGIRRHYDHVADELRVQPDETRTLPSRVHSIVLVSNLHKPVMRALAFARATRPDSLVALTVNVDDNATRKLQEQWDRYDIPLPLVIVESPYRDITKPVIDYIKRIRREGPRDLVMVFVPEYVVGRWWEKLLHNRSAFRLKSRLLFMPGVMTTSVPWQLQSAKGLSPEEPPWQRPGSLRQGIDAAGRPLPQPRRD
ncbi:APC family permease [Blastococcus sp. Marseille-P5729]|uniref:APC family permease n=1 Tax=Blastococcus sp. Marseille-P5729 TaxID=2086582 RepID=UPI000D0FDEEC|nr:APC family permease [Blastococcus sp. Marseille-P5729]